MESFSSDNLWEVLSVGCSVQDYSDEVFHEGSWESKMVKRNQRIEQWSGWRLMSRARSQRIAEGRGKVERTSWAQVESLGNM